MFRVAFHHPQVTLWQHRLSRVPRWGWLVIGVAVVLPLLVLLAGVALVVVASGAVALGAVLLVLVLRSAYLRIASHFGGQRTLRRGKSPLTHVVVRRVYDNE